LIIRLRAKKLFLKTFFPFRAFRFRILARCLIFF
jgi:hypothetical protein